MKDPVGKAAKSPVGKAAKSPVGKAAKDPVGKAAKDPVGKAAKDPVRDRYTVGEVAAAARPRDSWWTVLAIDPVAIRLTRLVANRTPITPSQLTLMSGLLACAAMGSFLQGGPGGRLGGAALFTAAFVFDCMDGKLARLTGRVTEPGAWLGAAAGRIGFVVCALALLLGKFARTGYPAFVLLAVVVVSALVICDVLGARPPRRPRYRLPQPRLPEPWLSQSRHEPRWRSALALWRLRGRPVSETEFAMAVCLVAPLTDTYIPVIGLAAALLVGFELAAACLTWRPSPPDAEPSSITGAREPLLPLGAPR